MPSSAWAAPLHSVRVRASEAQRRSACVARWRIGSGAGDDRPMPLGHGYNRRRPRRPAAYNSGPFPHDPRTSSPHDANDEGAGQARSRQGHLDGTGAGARRPGPNEVLIKLEKTAICGTDLHIYLWDEWSQRTIKPGLVIGHEFVGRIVELGPGVTRLQARPARVGRRPHRLRPLPQLPRRPPAPVPEHRRHRRQPRRRVRRIHRDAGQQPVADPGPDPERARRVLRSLRQRRALRAGVRRGRRGRADHRRRPDRHHRRRHLQAHRRAQRRRHRRQRLSPEARRRHGRDARGQRRQARR